MKYYSVICPRSVIASPLEVNLRIFFWAAFLEQPLLSFQTFCFSITSKTRISLFETEILVIVSFFMTIKLSMVKLRFSHFHNT